MGFLNLNRKCHSFLNIPTKQHNSLMQQAISKAKLFFPRASAHDSPTELNVVVIASIPLLFLHRRPSYVSRFVVAVWIRPAVNRMLWCWSKPDISEEGGEPIIASPSFKHCDAATAVMLPCPIVWVRAPTPDGSPADMLWSTGVPVSCRGLSCRIDLGASARSRVPSFQKRAVHNRRLSAVAKAAPFEPPVSATLHCESSYGQPTESLSEQIQACHKQRTAAQRGGNRPAFAKKHARQAAEIGLN